MDLLKWLLFFTVRLLLLHAGRDAIWNSCSNFLAMHTHTHTNTCILITLAKKSPSRELHPFTLEGISIFQPRQTMCITHINHSQTHAHTHKQTIETVKTTLVKSIGLIRNYSSVRGSFPQHSNTAPVTCGNDNGNTGPQGNGYTFLPPSITG